MYKLTAWVSGPWGVTGEADDFLTMMKGWKRILSDCLVVKVELNGRLVMRSAYA